MKVSFKFTTLILFASALAFTACDKDDDVLEIPQDDPTPTTEPAPATPQFSNADGSLWAVNSASSQSVGGFEVEINIGIAVGAFTENGEFNTLVDAGTVSVDDNNLTRQTNNAYSLTPSQTNPTGIDYNTDVNWSVSGGSGFIDFTYTSSIPWPTASEITSGGTVSKSSGYTLTVNTVENADSVLFMVGSAIKTISGNATSCTFTSVELSGLDNGANVASVVPYASEPENFGGKTIYIGKEAVQSKSVTIED